MPVYNLFSKRQRLLRETPSDVLVYDQLPGRLRKQICYIISDTIGEGSYQRKASTYYEFVHEILLREYGLDQLTSSGYRKDSEHDLMDFIMIGTTVDEVLDAVEMCFRVIDKLLREEVKYQDSSRINVINEALQDLNTRFKENGVGYSYESGELIRIDSTYIHSEVVKPTLNLINNINFKGVDEEYRSAHEHYRHGRNKECLADCLKAFESTMKVICKHKGWTHDIKDTSKQLIKICFDNGLLPTYLQTQLTSLRVLLESGVPTIRNRQAGHGQGGIPQKVDDETARYALNLCGSNVLYLIELSNI
jgi:hypothetical protein